MCDRLAARRPPTIKNLSARTRRVTIGAAAVIPALLIGVLSSLGARADAEKLFAATKGTPWPHVDALRQDLAEIAGMHTVEAAVAEGIRRYEERSDNEGGAALPTEREA